MLQMNAIIKRFAEVGEKIEQKIDNKITEKLINKMESNLEEKSKIFHKKWIVLTQKFYKSMSQR